MGNLFTKDPRKKITDVDRGILALKTQRRKLQDYQKKLELKIERQTDAARELLRLRLKEKAKLILRKRKLGEEQLTKVEAWLLNVEELLTNIEIAGRQKAVFDSLKAGQKAITSLQKEIDVDEVQKLMDDTEEAREYQEELNRVLGTELSPDDEEAVLGELASLEAEFGLDDVDLPSVPAKPVPVPAAVKPAVKVRPVAVAAEAEAVAVADGDAEPEQTTSGEMEKVAVVEDYMGVESKSKKENVDEVLEFPDVPKTAVRRKVEEEEAPRERVPVLA